ncbi:sulfite exporter TauE/SafE family protein [Brachybacterium sp. JHP9]|uniref:Probable membrane transporter protein n=1 Tax=Brachybacterium equifaecis TaxID=2910770 RepID=A0ABT0QYD8_9MICO|nr:sulfite exporter TauE/SafE family protein [Brachybacterium equifaecis]MCL6422676.1 sulfite exporter TauE/SafE family protein [Brachybacterium equifaecis]
MDLSVLALLAAMGVLAGIINAAVGSGSLLTLPVLLAIGVPPGVAVRTNTIGMVFSTIGSVIGYRREIAEESRTSRLLPLLATTLVCAATGSVLLLISPGRALEFVVPVLIVVALVLVLLQPRIARSLARRRAADSAADGAAAQNESQGALAGPDAYSSPALLASMGAASLYGGYFTAAQGVLYLGVLGAFTGRPMKSVNAVKNLLSLIVNATAAVVYLLAFAVTGAEIIWAASAAIAVGSLIGGYAGSHLAKRLPEGVLRGIIVLVAVVALIRQLA